MKIIPKQGWALVELFHVEQGLIETPEDRRAVPIHGVVRAIGKWPLTRSGKAIPPEVKKGDKVIVGKHRGIQMRADDEKWKFVQLSDILAKVEAAKAA